MEIEAGNIVSVGLLTSPPWFFDNDTHFTRWPQLAAANEFGYRAVKRKELTSCGCSLQHERNRKEFLRKDGEMKKFLVVTLAWVICAVAAHAGIQFVGVDSVQTNYTANTKVLSLDDSSLVITIGHDDNTQSSIGPAGFTLNTSLVSGTNFAGGTFAFTDSSSDVILSGNVLSIDFQDALGFLVGKGTAQVLVSNLAGYPVGLSDIVSITFNLNPAFTGFGKDYTGKSKMNFLVPEPMTMLLLGLGAILLRKVK